MSAMAKKLPKSLRKFIRGEKAHLRREFLDTKKQAEEISKLYQRFFKQPKEDKLISASKD